MKFGAKLLLRDRGFTATAVLTLAVALGANLAVFSIVRSVLQKPLPFPGVRHRVMAIHEQLSQRRRVRTGNSVPDYFDRKRDVTAFSEIAIYRFQGLTVGEPGSTRRITGDAGHALSPEAPSGGADSTGRIFTEDEGEVGNEAKAILTYPLWQELYGGDPDVVGKEIRVNGTPQDNRGDPS